MNWFGNLIGAMRRVLSPTPDRGWLGFVPRTVAGMVITDQTALKYSAFYRGIDLISKLIATLPWHVYDLVERNGRVERRQVGGSNYIDLILHRQANSEMAAMDFRRMMVAWMLMDGNCYAEIDRDGTGRLQNLWPITPDRVVIERDDNGKIVYRVYNSGGYVIIPQSDMFHVKGLSNNGLFGYSVLSMAARTIGIGLAGEEFSVSYYTNGVVPSGVLQHPKGLSDDAYRRLKIALAENSAGPSNAQKPLILEEGMVWNTIANDPQKAQLLDSRRFQVADVARWLGVPLVLLEETEKSTSWGSGIEQIMLGFVKFTLGPIVKAFETEADIKLFGLKQSGRMMTKMNMDALVRGDMNTRKEYYKTMWSLGVYSANDILELEDRNQIGPDGDKRFVPMNMTTLEKAGQDQQTTPARQNNAATQQAADAITQSICNTLRHADIYERSKFASMVKRYEGDRSSFSMAVSKFFEKQRAFIANDLKPNITALFRLTGTEVDEYTITHAVDLLCENMERDWNIAFSKGSVLPVYDIEARTALFIEGFK